MSSASAETSPLFGRRFAVGRDASCSSLEKDPAPIAPSSNERRKNTIGTLFLHTACILVGYLLNTSYNPISNRHGTATYEDSILSTFGSPFWESSKSPYTKVQTLSFQIYTGGAPAYIADASTGKVKHNPECIGLNSYGLSGESEEVQCYLGLKDAARGIERRLSIMADAVEKAYNISDKDDSVLKIFIAPEFYFRGLNGAFEFYKEEAEEEEGKCSDICQILVGLEGIVADKRFENWLFLFGTVIASEALPTEDPFDYQFYNFAPLYKGFDPATSRGIGKNFIVPKRYVSDIDFLSPIRHLSNKSIAIELLDDYQQNQDEPLRNPSPETEKYGYDMWAEYKSELTSYGYNMIEYGWFFMDGISFSVEICLDHLMHRALRTYLADVATGSKTLIPSSANDAVEWVGIPKRQAQISLVSSAGMDVIVSGLVLADGAHIFLQDGMVGNISPYTTFGQDECSANEYEFFGGSQCVKRTAIVSATDVTFGYEMNMDYKDYDLYADEGQNNWKRMLKGVFSRTAYQPKLTVYDPVNITR